MDTTTWLRVLALMVAAGSLPAPLPARDADSVGVSTASGVRLAIQPTIGLLHGIDDLTADHVGPTFGCRLRLSTGSDRPSVDFFASRGYYNPASTNRALEAIQIGASINLYCTRERKVRPYVSLGGGIRRIGPVHGTGTGPLFKNLASGNLGIGIEVRTHERVALTVEPAHLYFSTSDDPLLQHTQLNYLALMVIGCNFFVH